MFLVVFTWFMVYGLGRVQQVQGLGSWKGATGLQREGEEE